MGQSSSWGSLKIKVRKMIISYKMHWTTIFDYDTYSKNNNNNNINNQKKNCENWLY